MNKKGINYKIAFKQSLKDRYYNREVNAIADSNKIDKVDWRYDDSYEVLESFNYQHLW